jgi:1,4-dihydroxy-2-naphthoate octaprenyltransferase
MSTAWIQIGVVALFAVMCGALAAAWLRGRLGVAAIALFVVACLIWVAAVAAIVSGYHDADGFLDCRDDCSSVQYASAVGFLAPPLLISLSAFGMIVVVGQRRRRRRSINEDDA